MVTLARWTAWIVLALLVFVTLAPIELRPIMATSPTVERAAAYALLGFLLCLAYPRQRLAVLIAVIAVAGLLEWGQTLTQSRHGRVSDFLVKAGAAGFGALVAQAVLTVRMMRSGPA